MSKTPFPSPTRKWHDNTYASLSPLRPELSAKGKTVAITGGGSGIGAETARQFAAAGAARIGIFGRREQPLLDTKAAIAESYPEVQVFTAAADVTNKPQLDTAFAAFLGDAKLDVIVSAAAKTGPMDSVADVDGEAFIQAVNANLLGALYTAQAFLRHAGVGAVAINVSSSAAHLNFGPGFASYNCSKIGAFRLWDSLAYANAGLSVFHLQPGVVDTDMNRAAGGVKALGFEDHVSLPATFCVWLASPEARFLNRKFLWANWDVDELKSQAQDIAEGSRLELTLVGWPFGANDWKVSWSM
ncbi:short-chain dehydrogenase [Cordyceps javanica]|uniref:Short-chain dehydrogenase n=1 Tax=Cordyceps javanica TaxID=43265 RepID=A0A545VVV5_9HYPO|nr:short-chain dehydrogenase [Cordyceps javanica]TQW05860.1 short-chain dehydrogenase [Cordyceps javanica]